MTAEVPLSQAAEPEHMEWLVQLALEMMRLGVSETVVRDLLAGYPPERIERQLRYLPFRNAKKPVSLLVASIKDDYEAPTGFAEEPHEA